MSKNIIYLKQKNVDFGSNYGSQIWYEFEDNCKESIYPVLPKVLSELVSFNLISVSGKPHQELIRSSIVDQLYELIRLLGIEDQKIKANLLNLLGKSLLAKGQDLTALEINELQEIYPEIKHTCVLDGYINKNINEAKRFMSFSLELKPDLIAYYDYLDILFNSYHLGEGEFDNNILFEIEDISLKILRIDNALANNDFLNKTLFLLQYLSENTSNLLATRISNTINLPKEFVQAFKQYIFDNLKDIDKEYPTDFNSYSYFDKSIIIVLKSDRFRYPFLYNNKVAEVYDAVRFIVNNYSLGTDYEEIISLLDTFTIKTYAERTSTNLALVSRFIWLWGNIPCGIDLKADSIITRIFKINNHELIGVLATALGRKKIDKYNAELIQALIAFDFESRRRIIWAMGEIGTSEFYKIISGLSIDPNNYALIEEQKNALNKLHLTPPH